MDSHPFSPFEVPFLGIPCETPFEPHRNTHQLPLATIPPGNAASIAFRFSSIFFSLSSCNWCLRKETHPGEYQGLNPNNFKWMHQRKLMELIWNYLLCTSLWLHLIDSYCTCFVFGGPKKKSPKSGVASLSTKGMGRNWLPSVLKFGFWTVAMVPGMTHSLLICL